MSSLKKSDLLDAFSTSGIYGRGNEGNLHGFKCMDGMFDA